MSEDLQEELPLQDSDPMPPEPDGLSPAWTAGAVILAIAFFVIKATGLALWSWTAHALVLILALEFLIRGPRTGERRQVTKLVRSALARGLCGALLLLVAVELSTWLTSRQLYPPWYRAAGFTRTFAGLTGLGWGAVWLVEALVARREESAGRDLLGGLIGGGVAFMLTAYAMLQAFYLGRVLTGQVVLKDVLDFARELISTQGHDELCFFLALSIPVALTTLGRLRRLRLVPLVGFSVLGTSALSGLFLSGALTSSLGRGRVQGGLIMTGLLSILLPLAWQFLDRFRLPGAETRAADAAMDEVIRIDRLRREVD